MLVLLLAVLTLILEQTPQTPGGAASIRGQVIDKASGEPLPYALVSLRNMREEGGHQEQTDARGRFEFTGVAAGWYELRATAGVYRTTHVPVTYGATPEGPVSTFNVKQGEDRDGIVIALPRALSISGRVLDEAGQPLTNISVTARARRRIGSVLRPRNTDDRGMFRLHGLAPGEYVICAEIRTSVMFGSVPPRSRHYRTTCYPSAGDSADAVEVTVADADVDGIEIRMPRSSLHTITGVAVTPHGAPLENALISLSKSEGSGSSSSSTRLQPGGAFVISNVSPGTYEVAIRTAQGADTQSSDREVQWGGVQVDVSTADVEGLIVVVKPGTTVKGRVSYEDVLQGSPPTALRVAVSLPGRSGNRPGMTAASTTDDGGFELKGLFGPVVVGIGGQLPRGYLLKSVTFRGRDITHIPVEFDGDPAHQLEILLTNRTAVISGRVIDTSGNAVPRAVVLHFPADPARRKAFTDWRAAPLSADGTYRVTVPAGEYLLAAMPFEVFTTWTMPDDIERLAAVGERVTVVDNERRTADLTFNAALPRRKR